jgi:predicted acyltransferase
MFLMMAEVLSFGRISKALPDSSFWSFLSLQQSHIPWVGCTLHDLIQPSFSFLVGIALPYSIASRATKGQSTTNMWYHTIRRSLILIFLGVFLRSMHKEQTNFTFEDTLSQIGLGYPILFALGFKSERTQWISLAVILVGYWLFFVLYPIAGPDFNWAEAGVAADWEHHLSGFAAHWNKNANAAWAFDRWFMNLFPRPDVFRYNGGGYSTLSFIPTLGTMLLGLIAGQWLRNSTSSTGFLRKLFTTAGILFAIAIFLNVTGLCPIVKRIWTPSWTLFSGAWCFVLLALFYFVVDIKQNQSWFRWLIVIGTNSIAAYVLSHTLTDLIDQSFRINISPNYDQILGAPYATLVSGTVILVVLWLILDWMYKKKLFIKI